MKTIFHSTLLAMLIMALGGLAVASATLAPLPIAPFAVRTDIPPAAAPGS